VQAGNDNAFVWLDHKPECVLKSRHYAAANIANSLCVALGIQRDPFNRFQNSPQEFST